MTRIRILGLTVGSMMLALTAPADTYTVTERQLNLLEQRLQELTVRIDNVRRDTDRSSIIPRSGDRSDFVDRMNALVQSLQSANGIGAWIRHARQNVGPGPVENVPLVIRGFYVVGAEESTNEGTATNSHQSGCDAMAQFFRTTLGNAFFRLDCGAPVNVSRYPGAGYRRFASEPVLHLRVPASRRIEAVTGRAIGGTVDDTNPHRAFDSWWTACRTWITDQARSYGNRFVGASCGVPRNISRYPGAGYFQYSSQGTLHLGD